MWQLPALSPREALEGLVATLRARLRTILACTVIALLGAVLLHVTADHHARLVLAINPSTGDQSLPTFGIQSQPPPTVEDLLADNNLKRMFNESLPRRDETVAQLRNRLSAVLSADGRRAELTARSTSDRDSRRLVSAWAQAVIRNRAQVVDAQIHAVHAMLAKMLATRANPLARTRSERRELMARRQRLESIGASILPDARVVTPASAVPEGWIGDLIPAAVLGLVAGSLLAFVLDLREGRLRTPSEIESAFGIRVLGVLDGRAAASDGEQPGAAMLRRIEDRLAATADDEPPRAVVVMSAGTARAASGAAAALQVAWTNAGHGVQTVRWDGASVLDEDAAGDGREASGKRALNRLVTLVDTLGKQVDRVIVQVDACGITAGRPLTQRIGPWLLCVEVAGSTEDQARTVIGDLDGFARPPAGLVLVAASS